MSREPLVPYTLKGPAAISGDWRRFVYLTRILAFTDFKLRFFGSVLGYVWTLMRPLLLFGVLYVVFSQIVRIGEAVRYYPVILLSGVVLFTYFSEATGGAVESVLQRENLVRKIHFPRMVIPLSVALTASINLLLNLVVVFFFCALAGVDLHWSWLQLPLIILGLVILSSGTGMLLAALYVRFRDVRPIWDIVLQGLFYGSPVFYPIEFVLDRNETLGHIAMMNPLAVVIQQFRHAVIDPSVPTSAEAIGGAEWLLVPAGLTVGLFGLGIHVFNRMAPRIAEDL